jgi:hypothetical protein
MPSVGDSASPPSAPAFDPAGLAKLDEPSRELLAVLEPGEWGQAYVDPIDLDRAVVVARAAGFKVADPGGPADALHLTGPVEAIIRLAADPSVRLVTLDENQRASRTVAMPLPAEAPLPVPRQPYRGQALPMVAGIDLEPARAAPLLAALGRSIVTIDGGPFLRLVGNTSCEPPTEPVLCNATITGWRTAANGFATTDDWSATEVKAGGPDHVVKPLTLAAIPRPFTREAERIARADNAASARIAAYTSISMFTWAPGPPLQISVIYVRPCQVTGQAGSRLTASVEFRVDLADTGSRLDVLSVRVDVAARRVVAIDEKDRP